MIGKLSYWQPSRKHLSLTVAFAGLYLCVAPVLGFSSFDGGDVHAEITREALRGVLNEANLSYVIEANKSQDKPGSNAAAELRRHFGEENFQSSLAYIDREKKRALNYAAESDSDAEARGYALRHLGELFHAVQDFYSRTNYLELMIENPQYKQDPFQIPLVDWQKVPEGYPGLKCYSAKAGTVNAGESALIVKDNERTSQGGKVISGKTTYFQAARDLAVRETARQWNSFEALVRGRCGTRAAAVMAALKEASPEFQSASSGSGAP